MSKEIPQLQATCEAMEMNDNVGYHEVSDETPQLHAIYEAMETEWN